MQGLLLSALFGALGLSACANDKFQDQPVRGATQPAQSVDAEAESTTENKNEAPTTPIDVSVLPEKAETVSIQKPIFADCQDTPDRPIVADLYSLVPNTQKLPDYAAIKSIKKICLSQLDIKTRNFSDGFPGVENLFEWFSLDMRFEVKVPSDGKWEFKLAADDGAILYIDNKKVVDNDGLHSVKEATNQVQLKAGTHSFHVSYFQGPRFNIALELFWKGPGVKEFAYIPKASMQRPGPAQLSSILP